MQNRTSKVRRNEPRISHSNGRICSAIQGPESLSMGSTRSRLEQQLEERDAPNMRHKIEHRDSFHNLELPTLWEEGEEHEQALQAEEEGKESVRRRVYVPSNLSSPNNSDNFKAPSLSTSNTSLRLRPWR